MSYRDTQDQSGDQRNLLLSALSEKKIKVIGLTGVIGAGKSSVIDILHQLGIPVIDCDRINEELQLPNGQGYQEIITAFGDRILRKDRKIDKGALGALIFHDAVKKKRLEDILHPLIKKRIQEWICTLDTDLAVVEVPLLFEIHWEACFDEIWVVSCDKEILLQRLSSQRQIDEEEALLRLSHQMSQEEKIKKADHVLHNDRDRTYLKEQIQYLLKKG